MLKLLISLCEKDIVTVVQPSYAVYEWHESFVIALSYGSEIALFLLTLEAKG